MIGARNLFIFGAYYPSEDDVMKRRELEDLLLTLETTPLVLAAHLRARIRRSDSPISVEDRIQLFAEIEETTWADQARALRPGSSLAPAPTDSRNALDRFTRARGSNLALLKEAAGVGTTTAPKTSKNLRSLLEAMAAADRTQLSEISRGGAPKTATRDETADRQEPVPALA